MGHLKCCIFFIKAVMLLIMKKKIEKFPEKEKHELVHKSAKALISIVPGVGGPINEFFNNVIASPLEKRKNKWLNNLAEIVNELQDKMNDFSIENLAENELFLTTILQATDIAMKNHKEEKLEMLKSVIQNTALDNTPEEDIQMIFMNYIDELTPWHIKLLKYFQDPSKWGKKNNIQYPDWISASPSDGLEATFPELKGKREIYDKLIYDLNNNYRLLNLSDSQLHGSASGPGIFNSRITNIGQTFIKFITPPFED